MFDKHVPHVSCKIYIKCKKTLVTVYEFMIIFWIFIFSLDYVAEIYKLFLESGKDTLASAFQALSNITPSPMDTMLEKQPRDEAIVKMKQRREFIVKDIPATAEGKICW